ncbi:rhomboid-related protein 4-like [Amblyomma americanum]
MSDWHEWFLVIDKYLASNLKTSTDWLGFAAISLVIKGCILGFPRGPSDTSLTPVAALLSAMILILRADVLPASWQAALHGPCLSAGLVLKEGNWKLLFLSPLHTQSFMHATYVVCSLLCLGCRFERHLGSARFALHVLLLTVATGLLYCVTAGLLASASLGVFDVDGVFPFEMGYKCFTGPTAVLLAMKVSLAKYTDALDDDEPNAPITYPFLWFLLPCPVLVGAATEAGTLQLLMPFMWAHGHLAGIAVGMAFFLLPRVLRS